MGAPTAKLETVVIVSPYKINALICALLTSVLLLISLITDNWLTTHDIKQGLWRNCTLASNIPSLAYNVKTNENDFFICVPLRKNLGIQVSGALVVVSLMCSIIGIVLIGLAFTHKKRQERKKRFYFAAISVYIFGVLSVVAALILFPLTILNDLHKSDREKWYFGWSYGVGWGASIFLLGALILLTCDRNREEIFYRERLYLNQEDDDVYDNQEAKIKTLNR